MVSKRAFYRSKKVLVIEDYEQVIAYMKSMLALIGFDQVVVARNAETAMSACRRTDFDFILCDYNLGVGRDGYQLFEALKDMGLSPIQKSVFWGHLKVAEIKILPNLFDKYCADGDKAFFVRAELSGEILKNGFGYTKEEFEAKEYDIL